MNANILIVKEGSITSPQGFVAGVTYAGIKKKAKAVLDLGILFSEVPCTAAALFTDNQIKAAPVLVSQKKVQSGHARAVIVNSGCANACTGEKGLADAERTAELAARALGIPPEDVLVASTGVIGVALPMPEVESGISKLALSVDSGHDLARAIMTTDTRPKEIAVSVKTGNVEYTIAGIAKGAGMIHPNMATMLSFLTTDAAVEKGYLKSALKAAVNDSFNMISVDGDTSTNDTIVILANGKAGNPPIDVGTEESRIFQQALNQVCLFLARSIARDGEGATRLIEVTVNGAASTGDARMAARTIVTSPLVKTAVHGCDPNWGRIIAAAGRSGAKVVEKLADVYIGDKCLLKSGMPLAFNKKEIADILNRSEVPIRVELNQGQGAAIAWGCDLSEEYVVINSEYTT
jgi:glutamate N-acetyltransferase / amino-acid N-acetyltransferase